MTTSPWTLADRGCPTCRKLADRHYSRQKPGSPLFVPPGRCKVFRSGAPAKALWVTSWPFAEYTKHAWAGAWICSLFRNEGAGLSSHLITEAIAATRFFWDPPEKGMVTFVKKSAIKSVNPGYCYKKAGFRVVGETKVNKLVALQMLPSEMPDARPPIGVQMGMFL